jgi:microfibrillar-associated protein 1
MQKYYHKGAFFQSAADDKFDTVGTFEIYNRDFNAPTGEDRGVDRSALPKPMQVRKGLFGRAGQTKWTHLGAEDTSTKDDAWAKAAASTRAKLTGANAPLSKPKHLTR